MAERKPVVLVGGQLQELPAGDALPPQAPAAHGHVTSDVSGLDAALAAKAPTGHGHAISDVSGLQGAIDAKEAAGTAAAAVSAHAAAGDPHPQYTTAAEAAAAAPVQSVAGKTGAVTLTNTDVGAAPVNTALTDAAASSTLPATASTALTALLQTVRDCLKWLVSNTVQLSGAQTVDGAKTFSNRSVHAGAYTPSLTPAHSATPTFDCSTSNVFEPAALTGNVTSITLSNAVAGQTVQIRFQQDATGGRTVAVPSGAKVDGTPDTGANRVNWLVLTYSSRGSRWEGNWLKVPA